MKVALLLLVIVALAQLGSCTSPLDLETSRLDSVIVPSVKLRTMSTTVWSGNGTLDTMVIFDWAPIEDTLYFKLKEDSDPPRLTLYTRLTNDTIEASPSPIELEMLVIDLKDLPANGTFTIGDQGSGMSRIIAWVKVNGQRTVANPLSRNFEGVVQLTYTDSPVKRVDGTITITVPTSETNNVTIVVQVAGEA